MAPEGTESVVRGSSGWGEAISRRRSRLVRKYLRPLLVSFTPRRVLNVARGEFHLWRGDTILTSLPYVVAIDPTNICNLRCPLCPTGQLLNERPFGRMSLDLYKGIIDQMADASYKVTLHNWGEPLLHPKIAEMVSYASERRLATEFSSNLNLLSDGVAEDLVRAGLARLVVSIDGATQEAYALYRKGGSVDRVLENVARIAGARRRLGRTHPFIEAQVLVMRHNERELDALGRKVLEAGADHLELGFTVVNTLDPKQMDDWLPAGDEFLRYDRGDRSDRFFTSAKRCSWLWRSLVVNWDGTVYPCCNFERKGAEVGDLTKESLRQLWNSPMYREARRVFRKPAGALPEGPQQPGQHICDWCRGVPRAQDSGQQGVY